MLYNETNNFDEIKTLFPDKTEIEVVIRPCLPRADHRVPGGLILRKLMVCFPIIRFFPVLTKLQETFGGCDVFPATRWWEEANVGYLLPLKFENRFPLTVATLFVLLNLALLSTQPVRSFRVSQYKTANILSLSTKLDRNSPLKFRFASNRIQKIPHQTQLLSSFLELRLPIRFPRLKLF